jgi:hypothetical protein
MMTITIVIILLHQKKSDYVKCNCKTLILSNIVYEYDFIVIIINMALFIGISYLRIVLSEGKTNR